MKALTTTSVSYLSFLRQLGYSTRILTGKGKNRNGLLICNASNQPHIQEAIPEL